MKKLLLILMLLPFIGIAQEEEQKIMSSTSYVVKEGHEWGFVEGAKMYIECYKSNGGEGEWNTWRRVQGEGVVYSVNSMMDKWAEMDERDPASRQCYSVYKEFIVPHIKSAGEGITVSIPELTRKTERKEQAKLAWVTYYDVENSQIFRSVLNDVKEALIKEEGDVRNYWYDILGGSRDSADYMVAGLFSNYAELDNDRDSSYEVYTKVNGEEKAKELSERWRMAVNDSWSYIWEHKPDLSN
jgi:hypothetical protein